MNRFEGRLFGIVLFASLASISTVQADSNNQDLWPSANHDIENTSSSLSETKINKQNVKDLKILWEYLTVPDTNTPEGAMGNVSAKPSVTKDKVFFSDWSGNITALKRKNGQLLWKKNLLMDISTPGNIMNYSRNTPVYTDGMVIIGESHVINSPQCAANVVASDSLGCNKGDGATVVALDENDGHVLWRTKVENHQASKITGSVSVHGNVIYVPVASWEEDQARNYKDPNDPSKPYPCCSFRGSIVALDKNNGNILWKSYTSIGNDPDNTLSQDLRDILFENGRNGYWGVSTYGHGPAIDTKRKSIYYATAQTYTAPYKAELCEEKRRALNKAEVDIPGFPAGVNCNNLNQKLKTYGNAIVALNQNDGSVKWAFYARQYDAWVHSCDAPDLTVGGLFGPVFVPLPLANKDNCPALIGPDMGFGHQPMLIKDVKGIKGKKDLVVAANKDGRVFAIDADTGKLVWEQKVDPGNIYGGAQFGIATDGKRIFVPTTNGSNTNRDKNLPFVPEKDFLDANGFTALGLRAGLFTAYDGDPGTPYPGPGPQLPFDAPQTVYGPRGAEYAGYVPDPMTGPISGPKEFWTLVHPPSDVPVDNINVFKEKGKLKTISGMITALDASTGKILWQRPTIDGIAGYLSPSSALGAISVTKEIVFAGYYDTKGTMVALDSNTGKKLFQFNAKIDSDGNGTLIPNGCYEGGPAIVDGVLYLGVGAGTGGAFEPKYAGNRVYALTLDKGKGDKDK